MSLDIYYYSTFMWNQFFQLKGKKTKYIERITETPACQDIYN